MPVHIIHHVHLCLAYAFMTYMLDHYTLCCQLCTRKVLGSQWSRTLNRVVGYGLGIVFEQTIAKPLSMLVYKCVLYCNTLCGEYSTTLASHDTGTQSPDSDNVQYQDWKTTQNITLQQSLLSLFLYSIAEQYICLIELVVHCSSCLNRALRRVFHARLTDPLLDHFQVIVNSSTYSWMVSHSA